MTTQLMRDMLAHPPPFEMDLMDANRAVGWIVGDTIGFRGFGDETEATHAAWVAHRTLARRPSRTHRTRPGPVDLEPLTPPRSPRGPASSRWTSSRWRSSGATLERQTSSSPAIVR